MGTRSEPRPAPAQAQLAAALAELTSEVGIPLDDLLRVLEAALADAYRRAFQPPGEISVRVDPLTGALAVQQRTRAEDGSETVEILASDEFRRLAAQTAKHSVIRQLRNLEGDRAIREAIERKGELANGIIDRLEAGTCYLDLGRAEGVMPPDEQIPGEELRPGRPLTVVILDARRHGNAAQVRVSRAARAFVQKLLEAEVPEIAKGVVKVMAMAREAGLRTKIAVASDQPAIDPVGACVGPRGVRHRSLLSELEHEHVDIVPWYLDTGRFVAAALGPAQVVSVSTDPRTRTATVLVPRTQLSLAIGKDGQNARLAAKLTGWRIDIKPAPDSEQGGADETEDETGGREDSQQV
jgi:N utilization substance protein A